MSKRIIVALIIAVLAICVCVLAGCEKKEEENEIIVNNQTEEKETVTDEIDPRKEKMYGEIISNYENALAEYDLNDLEAEERIKEKYNLEDTTLLMHLARYSSNEIKLTKMFYDIDKNGTDELILGTSNAMAVIYTFDKNTNKPVFVYALDTIERGNLSIYDNGIIFSAGSGGAMLNVYEFGKMDENGTGYELIEKIEEEYTEESEVPEYTDVVTGEKLAYKSLDEIFDKYISDAKIVNVFGDVR